MKLTMWTAALVALAPAIGLAQTTAKPAGGPPVTIGVLVDMSGTVRDMTGPGSVLAAQMAADDFGGAVLGRPIKIISADHQLKPDIGASIAARLV